MDSAIGCVGVPYKSQIRLCFSAVPFKMTFKVIVLSAHLVDVGPAHYDFSYAVKHDYSSNDFGHQENRNGYTTQGAYFALLPDGRMQRVSYNVNGDAGYVAPYEGEAEYAAPRPSPSYQPAHSYDLYLKV
ncbi:cuticle protein 7-like [Penaeus indicus]|uniref:cuticle protein 7-like n=1 Tax=Penaeus indicus TaxID=29960 RepID=UPI00300CB206